MVHAQLQGLPRDEVESNLEYNNNTSFINPRIYISTILADLTLD